MSIRSMTRWLDITAAAAAYFKLQRLLEYSKKKIYTILIQQQRSRFATDRIALFLF